MMPRCVRRWVARLAAVAVLVVAVLAVAKFGLPGWPFGSSTTDRTQPALLHEVVQLEQLTAAEGRFSIVVDVEHKTDGVPSVIAGDRTTMIAVGTVPAVVDLGGLTDAAVTVHDDGRVVFTVPAPTLGPPVIDHDQTMVTGRQRGLLDRLGDAVEAQPVDDQPLYQLATVRLSEAAVESDLIAEAEVSVRRTLTGLAERLGYDPNVVTVEFDQPKETP